MTQIIYPFISVLSHRTKFSNVISIFTIFKKNSTFNFIFINACFLMGDLMIERKVKSRMTRKILFCFLKGKGFGGMAWYVSCSCLKKEQLPESCTKINLQLLRGQDSKNNFYQSPNFKAFFSKYSNWVFLMNKNIIKAICTVNTVWVPRIVPRWLE